MPRSASPSGCRAFDLSCKPPPSNSNPASGGSKKRESSPSSHVLQDRRGSTNFAQRALLQLRCEEFNAPVPEHTSSAQELAAASLEVAALIKRERASRPLDYQEWPTQSELALSVDILFLNYEQAAVDETDPLVQEAAPEPATNDADVDQYFDW